jgi:hypothetical protein
MKNATVEDVISGFPHLILPTVQGEPDYPTIHSTLKSLRTNSHSIETHLGGGALGLLSIVVSAAAYAIVALENMWENPEPPGGASSSNWRGTATLGRSIYHLQNLDYCGASSQKANYNGI